MTEDDSRKHYQKWRNGFVVKLALFHFALVFTFDMLAIYTPDIMTRAIGANSSFTIGLVFAFGIILSVICSTFYYSHRINQKETHLSGISE